MVDLTKEQAEKILKDEDLIENLDTTGNEFFKTKLENYGVAFENAEDAQTTKEQIKTMVGSNGMISKIPDCELTNVGGGLSPKAKKILFGVGIFLTLTAATASGRYLMYKYIGKDKFSSEDHPKVEVISEKPYPPLYKQSTDKRVVLHDNKNY